MFHTNQAVPEIPILNISDKHHKIYQASLFICLVSLPFSRLLMSVSLIILTINWIWEGNMRQKILRIKHSPFALILIGFFLIHIPGLFYSDNQLAAWNDLQVKLPLLLFPMILASISKISRDNFQFLLKSYIISCLIAVGLCLSVALFYFLQAGNSFTEILGAKSFNYELLAGKLNHHPTYFSLLINLAMLALIWIWYQERNILSVRTNLIFAASLLFFLTFLMLLSAKMQILAFAIIGGSGLIYRAFVQAKWKSSLIFISLTLLFMAGMLALNPANHSQMQKLIQSKTESAHEVTSKNVRLNIWKAVAEVAAENSLMGVGIGDRTEVLLNTYEDNDYQYGIKNRFNAHSQYGETMLGLGIMGLSFLLISLGFSVYLSVKQRNPLFLGFLLLLILSFLTESMLTRQLGVFSYALFNGLFAFQMKPHKAICHEETTNSVNWYSL